MANPRGPKFNLEVTTAQGPGLTFRGDIGMGEEEEPSGNPGRVLLPWGRASWGWACGTGSTFSCGSCSLWSQSMRAWLIWLGGGWGSMKSRTLAPHACVSRGFTNWRVFSSSWAHQEQAWGVGRAADTWHSREQQGAPSSVTRPVTQLAPDRVGLEQTRVLLPLQDPLDSITKCLRLS